jgi:hypothetical protein
MIAQIAQAKTQMETTEIHLQGLNYKSADREAPVGICRELENLHPTGDPTSLVWQPIVDKVSQFFIVGNLPNHFAFQAEGFYPLIDGYHWKRANKPSLFVFIVHHLVNNEDWLCASQIDASGNVMGSRSITSQQAYYKMPHSNANNVTFAQMGDQLIICIARNNRPFELLQMIDLEEGTVCLPYNLPPCPLPEVQHNGTETEHNEFVGLIGFIFAWELFDGTICRPSNVKFFTGSDNLGSIIVQMKAQTSLAAQWKSTVRGIAVFMTDAFTEKTYDKEGKEQGKKTAPIDNFAENAVFKRIGVLEKIFESDQEIKIDFTKDDYAANSIVLDEDILTTGSVVPSTIFSYNRQLILGDVQIDYPLPLNLDGNISSDPTDPTTPKPTRKVTNLSIAVSKDPTDESFKNKSVIQWERPSDSIGVNIERKVIVFGERVTSGGGKTFTAYLFFDGATYTINTTAAFPSFDYINVKTDYGQNEITDTVLFDPPKVPYSDYAIWNIRQAVIIYAIQPVYADGSVGDFVYTDKTDRLQ